MRIKNGEVEKFAQFLLSLKLKGAENRVRTKFVRILQNHLKEVQKDHEQLLEEYCGKDENGQFITVEKDGKSFYDIEDVAGFQKEFINLMEEELIIPVDESMEVMLEKVYNILVNIEIEFSGREALEYETYLEMFEEAIAI